MDNFFQSCPPLMNDGRAFTDYRQSSVREQANKQKNGIVREDNYRIMLQSNGGVIMDKAWEHSKKNNSCFPNQCIHNYPTRSTPGMMYEELTFYNAVRSESKTKKDSKCNEMEDYRMTYTNSK
jgi:hypothetical protein